MSLLRQAIREEQKLQITYRDEAGHFTERTLRPIALVYYSAANTLVAWCELRHAIHSFRADRVQSSTLLPDYFKGEGDGLRAVWVAGWHSQT